MAPEILIGGVASTIVVAGVIAALTRTKRSEYPSEGHGQANKAKRP